MPRPCESHGTGARAEQSQLPETQWGDSPPETHSSSSVFLSVPAIRAMLLATVREVANGEFRVQGEAARLLLAGMGRGPSPVPPSGLDRLTLRERQILKMFAQGMSYAQIGEARSNNPMSVRNAIYAIQKKIGVWAARSGLLDDDEPL